MKIFMTLRTNRDNIKPMFRFIGPMVILFCLLAACTPIMMCGEQFSCTNSTTDFVSGLFLFGIVFIITFACLFAFVGLEISLFDLFVFFGLAILPRAVFAIILQPVTRAFRKLGQWKDSLAFRTSFCFNWFRHGLIPYIKSCLEPVSGYIPVSGLLYYSGMGMVVNKNNIILGY